MIKHNTMLVGETPGPVYVKAMYMYVSSYQCVVHGVYIHVYIYTHIYLYRWSRSSRPKLQLVQDAVIASPNEDINMSELL